MVENNYIYHSFIDVGKSNGPGINEYEFINTLSKLRKVTAVIPKPSLDNGTLPSNVEYIYIEKPSLKNPIKFLKSNREAINSINKSIIDRGTNVLIFRPSRLMLTPFIFFLKKNVYTHAKHFNGTVFGDALNADGFMKKVSAYSVSSLDFIFKFLTCKLVNSLDVTTIEQKKFIEKSFRRKENVLVINNGVNTKQFFPLSKEKIISVKEKHGIPISNKVIVGYAGGVPLKRGAKVMLDLATKKNMENFHFVIVGADDATCQYANKYSNLDNITLINSVPYESVNELISTFDIGIGFDDHVRVKKLGNSNQKTRQYLATGTYIVTCEPTPELTKCERNGMSFDLSSDSLIDSIQQRFNMIVQTDLLDEKHQKYRVNYAKSNLSTEILNKKLINYIEKNVK